MDYKNYILCGLLAFGMVATAFSKPASEERTAADDETLQNDQTDDYEYEDRNLSADQVKSIDSNPKSTVLPYFDNKIVRKTVKPAGNITLECPVKNLADTNVILWFKEENTITNNLNVLDNAYEVAKQNFSLIIKNATESFAGNYYCEIAPQKIRMQTILKISNETLPAIPSPSELPQVKEAVSGTHVEDAASERCAQVSLVLVSLLVSNFLSNRKCFQMLLSY